MLVSDSQEININIEDIVPFIRVINTNIEPFHMAIVKCTSERDGRDFYALVNRQECAITRLSSRYTSLELQLFQKLVGIQKLTYATSVISAIPLCSTFRRRHYL